MAHPSPSTPGIGAAVGATPADIHQRAEDATTPALCQPEAQGLKPDARRRRSRFGEKDKEVLRRMSDVFQFGIDSDRSRSTPMDSGSDDNFWEEDPTVAP